MPKWACATASLWSSRPVIGVGEERAQRAGVAGVEPAEAERRQLARHREGADGDRTAVQRRLDQRQPEALPRRRHRHRVARRVRPGHLHTERQPPPVGHAPVVEQRGELRLVAVLGRAGEPVGAADGGGEREPEVDALARDGAGRLEDERSPSPTRIRRRTAARCSGQGRSAKPW